MRNNSNLSFDTNNLDLITNHVLILFIYHRNLLGGTIHHDGLHTADVTEKRLITEVYDFAKSIAELQLTESELALYSALVLLQPGKFIHYDRIGGNLKFNSISQLQIEPHYIQSY